MASGKIGCGVRRLALALCAALAVSGCAEGLAGYGSPPAPTAAPPQKLQATGYGVVRGANGYVTAEGRLSALRAARVDAYRALAEQIYGVRVASHSSVGASALQSDTVRADVDTVLRGARIVSSQMQADGVCEVVAEIDLPVSWVDLPTRAGERAASADHKVVERCVGLGCGQAGAFHYSSN